MQISAKLGQAFSSFGDKIQEQVWFQQLRAKWDELDPKSRFYLQIAGLVVGSLLVIGTVSTALWSVHTLKRDYQTKNELLSSLQTANDELKRLRDAAPVPDGDGGMGSWRPYFEGIAGSAGIDPAKLSVGEEKPGATTDLTQEALVDVTLKEVNAKQLIRYATSVEAGSRPVKLRSLFVDTDPTLSGYLTARLSFSGFSVMESGENKESK